MVMGGGGIRSVGGSECGCTLGRKREQAGAGAVHPAFGVCSVNVRWRDAASYCVCRMQMS